MRAEHKARRLELPRPYDIETEQQLLGDLLLFNEHVERLAGFLDARHFAEPLHQRIYDAIVRAARSGQVASPFTLRCEFEADEAMAALGGARYLAELAAMAREEGKRQAREMKPRKSARKDADTLALEKRVSDALGLVQQPGHVGGGDVEHVPRVALGLDAVQLA